MNNYRVLPQNKPTECTEQEIAFCDGYGYEGHSHPIVKELTNMVKLNMVNRKCGNYVYQYGLPGMTDGKTIILNGKTYKKVARNAK